MAKTKEVDPRHRLIRAILVAFVALSLRSPSARAEGPAPALRPCRDGFAKLRHALPPRAEFGHLVVQHDGKIFWKGREVALASHASKGPGTQPNSVDAANRFRRIINALVDNTMDAVDAGGRGHPIRAGELLEEAYAARMLDDPDYVPYDSDIAVDLKSILASFKRVDPDFDAIRNVRGTGYSWYEPDARLAFRHGSLELTPLVAGLRWRGTEVKVTAGEFAIIEALVDAKGKPLPTPALEKLLVGGREKNEAVAGDSSSVTSLAYRIRKKFRAVDPSFDAIRADRESGWTWRAD